MAEESDKKPSFRGIEFDVESFQADKENELTSYEYIGKDGQQAIALGSGTYFKVTVAVMGQGWREKLEALQTALKEDKPGEFVCPPDSYMVRIKGWRVEQSADRQKYARVYFEAVETWLANVVFELDNALVKIGEKAKELLTRLKNALEKIEKDFKEFVEDIKENLKEFQQYLEVTFADFIDAYHLGKDIVAIVKKWMEDGQKFIDDVEKTVNEVQAKAEKAVSDYQDFVRKVRHFSIPGLLSGDKIVPSAVDKSLSGVQWTSGSRAGSTEAAPSVPTRTPGETPAAAPEAGSAVTPRGKAATYLLTRQTAYLAADLQEKLVRQLENPELTPWEVEAMVGHVRGRLQTCMDYARASLPPETAYAVCDDLREAAECVQSLGREALRARPALLMRRADREGNFRLLAHALYGDHSRAVELARLNPQITNPGFIARGQELLTYAR